MFFFSLEDTTLNPELASLIRRRRLESDVAGLISSKLIGGRLKAEDDDEDSFRGQRAEIGLPETTLAFTSWASYRTAQGPTSWFKPLPPKLNPALFLSLISG